MFKRFGLTALIVGGIAAPSVAGIISPAPTSADAPSFSPGYVIASPPTGTPQGVSTVNQQVNAGTTLTQTFMTGATGFQLDKIEIYSGGKGGGTARLNIYPDPVGGDESGANAGFVNTSFSTDLLNGGAGLEFTFNGSAGLQYITLDLTGTDEITLDPNQQYAIEVDVLTGQFSWQRDGTGTYPGGNLYQGGTEQNFNGTPPANNRGERFQVGGTPQRDAAFALYAVPEPSSLAILSMGAIGLLRRRRRDA